MIQGFICNTLRICISITKLVKLETPRWANKDASYSLEHNAEWLVNMNVEMQYTHYQHYKYHHKVSFGKRLLKVHVCYVLSIRKTTELIFNYYYYNI
jgi:hypothetical protein